jgi:hypothetical protein
MTAALSLRPGGTAAATQCHTDVECAQCTQPYDCLGDSASGRMLAPFSSFVFGSDASLSRAMPVIRLLLMKAQFAGDAHRADRIADQWW